MYGVLRSGFVALACLAAGAAQAVLLDVTYEGRLTTFKDEVGNFAGFVFDGDVPTPVTARFRFDTSLGVREDLSSFSADRERISGSSNQPTGVPVVSASITVGDFAYALRSPFREGRIDGENGPNPFNLPIAFRRPERLLHLASFSTPGGAEQDFMVANITGLSSVFFDPKLSLIEAERSHAAIPGLVFGEIQFRSFIVDSGFGGRDTFLTAALTGMSVTVVSSGVPEPSTWAMMLIGFAGLAHAARRRQAAALA